MKLALALALLPGVSAQQQHMLGAQGPTIALDRFAGFDTGAGPLSDAELPAAARTLDGKFSKYDHRKLPAKQQPVHAAQAKNSIFAVFGRFAHRSAGSPRPAPAPGLPRGLLRGRKRTFVRAKRRRGRRAAPVLRNLASRRRRATRCRDWRSGPPASADLYVLRRGGLRG